MAWEWPSGDGDRRRYAESLPYEVRGMLRSRANTIEGGTTEVNKNIVGERVLGLPREPDPYHGRCLARRPRGCVMTVDRRLDPGRRAARPRRLADLQPARRAATRWTPRCSTSSSGVAASSTPTPTCG